MKDNLTVWSWGASKLYYLLHPWKWIRELFYNIQCAYERITKGYCYLDWFNFDLWFLNVIPKMLNDLADEGHGYPGSEKFQTHDQWRIWLHQMARQLNRCSEEWRDNNNVNEYQEDFMNMLKKAHERTMKNMSRKERRKRDKELIGYPLELTPEEKELQEKYYMRDLELMKESQELIVSTLTEIGENFHALWD